MDHVTGGTQVSRLTSNNKFMQYNNVYNNNLHDGQKGLLARPVDDHSYTWRAS